MDKAPSQFILVDVLAYIGTGAVFLALFGGLFGEPAAAFNLLGSSLPAAFGMTIISYVIGFATIAMTDTVDAIISDGKTDEFIGVFKKIYMVCSFQWSDYEKWWEFHATSHERAFKRAFKRKYPEYELICGSIGTAEIRSSYSRKSDDYIDVVRLRTLERLAHSLSFLFVVFGLIYLVSPVFGSGFATYWWVGFPLLAGSVMFCHQASRLSKMARLKESVGGMLLLNTIQDNLQP